MPTKKVLQYSEIIRIPIYEENILVIFTNNLVSLLSKFGVDKRGHKNTQGIFIEVNEELVCIFGYPVSINTIVHETSHIVDNIIESRGLEPTGEPRAYLSGFISESIVNLIDKTRDTFEVKPKIIKNKR